MEIHQKKGGPDCQRLKTMVKRSIEQDLRIKSFGARNGNYGRNAVVDNQGTKQREQRTLGDCWQWETNGPCVKGDNDSFRHDTNKRGKVTPSNPSPNSFMQQSERKSSRTRSPRGRSPSGRTSRWPCKDYLRGTCNNSFCENDTKTRSGCRLGRKCSYAHRQFDEQPSKRYKKIDDKSAVAMLKKYDLHAKTWQLFVNRDKSHDRTGQPVVKRDTRHELNPGLVGCRSSNARQLGCVFQDMKPPKSILRKSSDMQKPFQRVKFTKAIARHTKIRDQNPSLGMICPGCLGKVLQHPECNEAWKNRVAGVRAERSYRDYDAINGESTEFEWNIFPGFTTLQLCDKISDLLSSMGQTPESFTGRILFTSMVNVIFCDRYDNKDECLRNANIVKTFAGRFGIGQWSFIGPGSEKKWYSSENSPQGAWDNIAEQMLLEFVQRLHFPGVVSRGKGEESCRHTSLQIKTQLIQFFALFFLSISSVSTEQWQLYAKNLRTIKIERGNL